MTESEAEALEEQCRQINLEDTDVKEGDIFYHVDSPGAPTEVLRVENYGSSGLYWWMVSFQDHTVTLAKNSQLRKGGGYFEYFRSQSDCYAQVAVNLKKKAEEAYDRSKN